MNEFTQIASYFILIFVSNAAVYWVIQNTVDTYNQHNLAAPNV